MNKMCDCNQGRLPCTCKTIEGAKIMSEVKRWEPRNTVVGYDMQPLPDGSFVLSEDFDRVTAELNVQRLRTDTAEADLQALRLAFENAEDGELNDAEQKLARVTAERKALQERLNAADQKGDDQAFQLKDREGSRRDWFDEAQRLQAELASANADKEAYAQNAINLRERLDKTKADSKLLAELDDATIKQQGEKLRTLTAKLAERDALIADLIRADGDMSMEGSVGSSLDAERRFDSALEKMKTLSASAEPSEREAHALQAEKALGIERLPAKPSAPNGIASPQGLRLLSADHCKECGHPDCNGQCYGDDMMGDL